MDGVTTRVYPGSVTRPQFGAALGTALLAPTLFALTGPAVLGLREQAKDPVARRHLRIGQMLGTLTVLGVGFASGALVDDNRYVLIGAAVGAVGMFAVYEYALSSPKPETQDDASSTGTPQLRLVIA
jgi:hypothetical protein